MNHRHNPQEALTDEAGERAREERVLQVIGYHQQTKHHFYRYARALGYMDWANQPNPFRRYEGARLIRLPILTSDEEPLSPPYDLLFATGAIPARPVTVRTVSRFLEYALALSAWKEAGGSRWALRSNPSSGNLHPTEGYVLLPGMPDLLPTPALYHYAAKDHALERRADWPEPDFTALMKRFPPSAFLLVFTSIHWREAWKYGERAFRYCQHDAGHAVGAGRIAAAALGWNLALLDDVGDATLAELVGLHRSEDYLDAECEHPDCAAVVWPREPVGAGDEPQRSLPMGFDQEAVHALPDRSWFGKANRLSRDRAEPWDIIDVVAAASWKPTTEPRILAYRASGLRNGHVDLSTCDSLSAGQIVRQRRSALAFDGSTGMAAACFYSMLARVVPHAERPVLDRPMPWDAVPWNPAVHFGLFVHRVQGLEPGLYVLVRDVAKEASLRQAMHDEFVWTKPPGCPDELALFLLQTGDARKLAAQVSCHQEIAADGAFSLGMLAEFEATLRSHGPWFYRRLFWETGLIGQVLYLEAEAAGLRATGIGCFFDDPVHQVFGIADTAFQSLYHFTVGRPVDDPRLTTLPPYPDTEVG